MNSEERFYLIQRLEEKLDIKFTDIQLDFLMDNRAQLLLMSRRAGKDLLLKARVAISMVEHCLDENYHYIGLFCLENTSLNAVVAADIERYVDMLLPPHLKALKKEASYSRVGATLTIGRAKLSVRPKARQIYANIPEVDMVGARFHEVYINEFGTSLSSTRDLVDVAIASTLEFRDNEGKVHIVGTPRFGITEEDVENTFDLFVIKKAPGLESDNLLGIGSISIDGSAITTGTIRTDSIRIGDLASDVLTTVPRQPDPNSFWLRTPEELPTMRFTINADDLQPIRLDETREEREARRSLFEL